MEDNFKNINVVRASKSDYKSIIEHCAFCFEGTNFEYYVPKIYRNCPQNSQFHYIVKDEDIIVGAILFYPSVLDVCGYKINVVGVGSVSVHPDYRNKGIMSKIFAAAEKELNGCDMSVLHGQRQRYEKFGFSISGMMMECTVATENIETVKNILTVKEVRKTDVQIIKLMEQTHNNQIVKVERATDSFFDTLFTYGSSPYAFYKDGEYCGFACFAKKKKLFYEFHCPHTLEVVKAILECLKLDSVIVRLPFNQTENIAQCVKVAEVSALKHSCNIKINNYPKLIESFLKLKSTVLVLDDGEISISIDKQVINIAVKNNSPKVSVGEVAEFSLSKSEADEKLFSNSGFVKPFYKNWFPLPLYYPDLDNV